MESLKLVILNWEVGRTSRILKSDFSCMIGISYDHGMHGTSGKSVGRAEQETYLL
jgi:hypothetical protein